jgi:hypothetical protein
VTKEEIIMTMHILRTTSSAIKQRPLFGRVKLHSAAMLIALVLFILASGIITPAHAAGQYGISKFSDQLGEWCAQGDPLSCFWWWLLDPPGQISHVGFQIQYDPSKIRIDVADSGFLCDFSTAGSCPVNAPGTLTQLSQPLAVGGPRSGTNYTLMVGTNTVTLNYDLSANPALAGSDRDFFGLAFTTVNPEYAVQFTNQAGLGDMYQVSTVCLLTDTTQCGSDNPGSGFSFTPEPSSLFLLGSGALGLSGILRRRVLSRN